MRRALGAALAGAFMLCSCADYAPTVSPRPSPSPTATPTPAATPTPPTPPPPTLAPTPPPPPPTPPAAGNGVVYSGPSGTNLVALTFDGAGRSDPAMQILDELRSAGVHSTIFLSGRWAEVNSSIAQQVVLDGHQLGNHSYSHPHMGSLSQAADAQELMHAQSALEQVTATDPQPWFRPPYGETSPALIAACHAQGYPWVVGWSIDTIDWSQSSTATLIQQRVLSKVTGGTIVLMHLGGYHTAEALPSLITELRARGYRLVTLGQMFGLNPL